jgi:hypothetical protein
VQTVFLRAIRPSPQVSVQTQAGQASSPESGDVSEQQTACGQTSEPFVEGEALSDNKFDFGTWVNFAKRERS